MRHLNNSNPYSITGDHCLLVLSVFLLLLSGCGNDSSGGGPTISSTTSVTLAFSIPTAQLDSAPPPAAKSMLLANQSSPENLLNQSQELLSNLLVPEAYAAAVPTGISSIIVEITGPGMTIISDVIAVTAGLLQVTRSYMVPSGVDRTVSVTAVNAANSALYQGSALIPLMEPGKAVSVPMPLQPTTNPLTDTLAPVVTAPVAITVAAVDAAGTPATQASLVTFLNSAIATDNIGVISLTHNAPVLFPLGVTTVTFTAIDAASNFAIATSSVTVNDQTPPQITLLGGDPVTIIQRSMYNDAGATALDNVDGDITANIVTVNPVNTATTGTYTVSYNVSDAAGNTATQVTRTVNVSAVVTDITRPVITLLGTNPTTITQGSTYSDAGATALDNVDGDITANIVTVNPVNTGVIGSYTITYDVTDAAANSALQVTRTVNVTLPLSFRHMAPKPSGEWLHDTAWNGGTVYVAVGVGGAYFSQDGGINWNQTISTSGGVVLQAVTWGGGLFIAVGDPGAIYSSSDGQTWSKHTSGTTNQISSVAWGTPSTGGPSLYVAIATSGELLTSIDGTTWNIQATSVPGGTAMNDLTFGNGKFIAVKTGTIITSVDGINWITVTGITATDTLNAVIWDAANASYFAAGNPGIYSSADGTNWVMFDTRLANWVEIVSAGLSWTLAFTATGDYCAIYQNTTLTPVVAGNTNGFYGVTGNASQLIAVGQSGMVASGVLAGTAAPILTWTQRNTTVTYSLKDVAWGGSYYAAVGSMGSTSGGILTSTDGLNWSDAGITTIPALNDITSGMPGFVAVGNSGTIMANLGAGWTQVGIGATTNTLNDIIWNGTQFVIVGNAGTILTSPDGSTWTLQAAAVTANNLTSVAWSGTQYVAGMGNVATMLTSPDAVTWTLQTTSAPTYGIGKLVWDGRQYVAVAGVNGAGTNGVIHTSTDAITWTTRYSTGYGLNNIIWTGSQLAVVGGWNRAQVLTSSDGINWSQNHSGSGATYLLGIAANGSQLVAVGSLLNCPLCGGESGLIMVSP